MQATGTSTAWRDLPVDVCQRQPTIDELVEKHRASEYSYIPFVLAMIEQNGTFTVSEGVEALEYYVSSISNRPLLDRKFTKIDFYELQDAGQSRSLITSITADQQNDIEKSSEVRSLVSRYAPDGAVYRIEHVKFKVLQSDQEIVQIIADPWFAVCLQDRVTTKNAGAFVRLAEWQFITFLKSHDVESFNEQQAAHKLLYYTKFTIEKVYVCNPKQFGAKELWRAVNERYFSDEACLLRSKMQALHVDESKPGSSSVFPLW